eukprot:4384041-Prymnesium_polylepis.4
MWGVADARFEACANLQQQHLGLVGLARLRERRNNRVEGDLVRRRELRHRRVGAHPRFAGRPHHLGEQFDGLRGVAHLGVALHCDVARRRAQSDAVVAHPCYPRERRLWAASTRDMDQRGVVHGRCWVERCRRTRLKHLPCGRLGVAVSRLELGVEGYADRIQLLHRRGPRVADGRHHRPRANALHCRRSPRLAG